MKQRYASKPELEHLFSTGAIKLRAQNTVLVSLPLLCFALRRMAGLSPLVPRVMGLATAEEHTPGEHAAACQMASPPEMGPEAPPVKLPTCRIDMATFPKHYSLSEELKGEVGLDKELKSFVVWLSTPIMLNRNGKRSAKRTTQNIIKNVLLYLGFTHHHYQLVKFSLDMFLDLDKYSAYISFQIAKNNGRHTLTQQISNARKVCEYLNTSAGPEKAARVSQVGIWLLSLSRQVVTVLPKTTPDLGMIEFEGRLMQAEDLVVMLDKLRREALGALPLDRNASLPAHCARMLHDAALSSTMFGHFPPPRLSCIRTLQVPWFRGCLHEDCVGLPSHQSCKGNKLELRGSEVYLVLSHHKNRFKWDGSVIQFRLPAELRDLMHVFLSRCHHVLSPGSPFVFTDHKSRPMLEASRLTHYWESILRRCGAEAIFPPSM